MPGSSLSAAPDQQVSTTLATTLAFAAVYFVCTLIGIDLSRQPNSLCFFSFGNGIAITYFLCTSKPQRTLFIALLFGVDLACRLLLAQAWQLSIALAIINTLQILLATGLALRFKNIDSIEHHPLRLLHFIAIVCCLAPLLGASLFSLVISLVMPQQSWRQSWPAWYAGACVGSLSFLPVALIVARQGVREFWQEMDLLRLIAAVCLIAAITVLAEIELPFPLIYPMGALVMAAILLPFAEISFLIGLATLLTIYLLANGSFIPPPMISYWQILFVFLPVFLVQVPPLLMAASISQAKLREKARLRSEKATFAANAEKALLYEDLVLQQRASLESAEKMQAILQNAADAIITTNAEGKIESFNRAAEKIYLCSEQQVLGQHIAQFNPREASVGARKTSEGYLELLQCRMDGSEFPAELVTSNFSVGGQSKCISIVRDLSERRRIEAVKNDFVATVSHELRTPLTSIRGGLGLVLGGAVGAVPASAERLLRIAASNAERLSRLVNDLLDIQQIENGHLKLNFAAYSIGQILQECVAEHAEHTQKYQVKIIIADAIPAAMVWVDVYRCKQIFGHILSNACKFSPAGAQVQVRASVQEHEGKSLLRVTISDQGCGIASDYAPNIFQKFSQADTSDTKAKGGTGLGLAIAAGIAAQMQVGLSFESAQGKGSDFYVDLPLCG